MDSNRIEGAADDVVGKVQDGMGGLLGDTGTQAKGKANQFSGQAQEYYGEALDTIRDVAADQPFVVIAVAAGIGFVLGALFARR
ncbi:MAG: CsbD family protein [Gluconacetobacter diazotrophicus]|nr:CsbD family protein [Gluconacetobacter diazotrophicus]